MKRVGVFGGSFNPLHLGHLGIAKAVVEQGLADEVWLMVSPQNPLKQAGDLLEEQQRFELAKAAVEDVPHILATNFEFALPRPSYTYATLEALEAAFPDHHFSLIIGGDNWAMFPKWANWVEILASHEIIVYPRADSPIETCSLPPMVHLLDAPLFPYSSTEIRRRLAASEDVSEMLPAAIIERCQVLYASLK